MNKHAELPFLKSTMNFKLWMVNVEDWAKVIKDLQSGAGCFVPEEFVSGVHDLNFPMYPMGAQGKYSLMETSIARNYIPKDKTHEIVRFNTLDSGGFILTSDCLITYGPASVCTCIVNNISALLGQSITQKEFDTEEMDALYSRLVNVSSITFNNPKDSEVRKATISGAITDIEFYDFYDKQKHGSSVDRIKGMFQFTDSDLLNVTITRKGSISITAKNVESIPLWYLIKIVRLIEETYEPEDFNQEFGLVTQKKEQIGELADTEEIVDAEESLSNIF